jgi:hypothetical protein
MANVQLQFLPPSTDDIVMLHVEEATSPAGPFGEIQTFPAGTYPDYITDAEVTNATNALDWFRIRWEDSSGNFTPYSAPMQGGTTTVVAQVMQRVILRDPAVNTLVAGQEAEATVSEYFGVDDPYMVDPAEATPKILSGLTLLALARAYTLRLIQTTVTGQKWTAGLVSMDAGSISTGGWTAIDRMIELANKELGRNYSRILLMNEITTGGGYRQLKSYDASRTLIEIA